jgi:hypothetical protein
MTLATLTAQARTFLAAVDAAAQRTAMGLGSAATRQALGTTGALYSRDSVLGTVSQEAGVPTGAIIERGSNANGEYVRFVDGTQICTKVLSGTFNANVPYGSVFVSAKIAGGDMPASFIASPGVSIVVETNQSSSYLIEGSSTNSSFSSFYVVGYVALAPGTYRASLTAVGRWF